MGKDTLCSLPYTLTSQDLLLSFWVLEQEDTCCKVTETRGGGAGALVHCAELCMAGKKGTQSEYLRYHSSTW